MTTTVFPMAHYLLATEGVALMRSWYLDDEQMSARLIAEVAEISAAVHEGRYAEPVAVTEQPVVTGYTAWARTYDSDNSTSPLITLESTALDDLIEPGHGRRALDAACGTGRQEHRLLNLGYEVTGVDVTPAMLDMARRNHPDVTYLHGDLRSLPVSDSYFDLVLSTLAITHVPELEQVVAELARVTRPNGTIVTIDVHPVQILLGAHATVPEPTGGITAVRNSMHLPSRYLAAFGRHGLTVQTCREPLYTEELAAQLPAAPHIPAANRIAFSHTPALLIWVLRKNGGTENPE